MAIQYPPAEAGPSKQPSYILSQSISAHERAVTALKFTPDGRLLVSAGADGSLHFWDAETSEHLDSIRCHRKGINDITISPDGLYIATASDDTTSQLHLLPSPSPSGISNTSISQSHRRKPLRHLKHHTAPILCIAFSPKSNLLVTGSFDESAIVWDVRRGKVLRILPAHAEAIWSVCWDNEGGMVVTGSADGLIRLWDANNGQCLKTLDNDTNSPVSFASFTPSSFFLLSSTLSSTIRLYNFHTSKVLKTLRSNSYVNEKYPCPAVVYESIPSPSRRADTDEQATRTTKSDHAGDENRAEGSMDVDLESNDAIIDVTEPGTTEKRKKKEAWVIAGSENGKLVIWELQSRKVLHILGEDVIPTPNSVTTTSGVSTGVGGHRKPVIALAVHPNGRTIASGSLEPEKIIHIWRWQDQS